MPIVARYTISGDLDPTFGVGGVVQIAFVSDSGETLNLSVQALRVDPTGHITVVAGGRFAVAVARYLANGEPDVTFGEGGQVISGFFSGNFEFGHASGATIDENPQIIAPVALGIEGPGAQRIVAVGTNHAPDDQLDFALARYRFSGELDPAFSGDGKVVTRFSGASSAHSAAIDNERCIVVAGEVLFGGSRRFAIARYLPDGSRDPDFSQNGLVQTPFPGGSAGARAVAIAGRRYVVAAGGFGEPGEVTPVEFAVARYQPDGDLDSAFGEGGRVRTTFQEGEGFATAVAVDRQNRVVVAGSAGDRFALARYRSSDGFRDPGFADDGRMTVNFSQPASRVFALTTDLDDSLIAVGRAGGQLALARVREDGSLDPSFGSGGKVRDKIGGEATAVTLDDKHRILVAG